MDPQISIEAEFKDGKLHTGLDRAVRAEEKMEEGLKKITREAKQADRELDRFVEKAKRIDATPQERYAKAVGLANQALEKGKFNQEEYRRAVSRVRTELDNAGNSQKRALGDDFLGQIKSFAAGYLTLSTAVNIVADAFRNASEESREALAGLRSLDDQRRRLNQVATSPADLQSMTERADKAAATYGVDRSTAYATFFEAKNYGIEDQFEQIMAAQQVIRPDAAVRLGGKMSTMFQGKINPTQAIDMGLVAAAESEMDFEQFASTMAIAGEGGRIADSSPEELMAAVSVLSAAFKSGQVAADRIKTFTTKSGLNPQLAGKGLMGSLDEIQAMSPESRAEFLKTDMELNAAYQSLSQFEGQIRGRQAELVTARGLSGTPGSAMAQGVSRAGANPEMRASREAAQAEISLELTKEKELAQGEAARVVSGSAVREMAIRRGGIGGRYGAVAGERAAGFLQMSGEQAGFMTAYGSGIGEAVQGAANPLGNLNVIADLLRDIRDNQKKPNHSGIGRSVHAPAQ